MLVDSTPPLGGWVNDGDSPDKELDYASDTASVAAVWAGFSDPETLVKDYTVDIYRTPAGNHDCFSNRVARLCNSWTLHILFMLKYDHMLECVYYAFQTSRPRRR